MISTCSVLRKYQCIAVQILLTLNVIRFISLVIMLLRLMADVLFKFTTNDFKAG